MTIASDGTTVLVALTGHLDQVAGSALIAAATAALDERPQRLDIDLRELESWTDDGADSLVACRDICSDLPGGLHYRTGRGPGREALLAAYR